MNKPMAIILVVALTGALAMGGIVQAQADKDQTSAYAVPMEKAGSGYHLDSGGWQVQGAASGGAYHLEAPAAIAGSGTPCCCLYMPCLWVSFP